MLKMMGSVSKKTNELHPSYRLGVDTGGTFTDLCVYDESVRKITVAKVPSTPADPSQAVISGIQNLIENQSVSPDQISFLIHGTTVATNALLEGKGAPTALITTEGFEDVILIGRQSRPKLYDFWAQRPRPIVPRSLCYGAQERILYTGEILKPLDKSKIEVIVADIKSKGVASIAVCLINSYANPAHENQIKSIIESVYPEAFVTVSAEVLPEFREYERISTICINAYVMPQVNAYIGQLEQKLTELNISSDLYIMQSNGGTITAKSARRSSARTALSGPAGGALTGVYLSKRLNQPDVITIDMGGTSSDICLIDKGQPGLTTEADIEGYPIKLPMIDINTIGAGGGSIAWIDDGGALRVGPLSAGADPGPVCYGRNGKEPTVTDANAILGRINPAYLLGGEMAMYLDRAEEMMNLRIAEPLGITLTQAAAGIISVVNANMIRGIRRVSVERGYDPRDFVLVAFGGAGPLHGVELAKALNMDRIIVPVHPGIASAFGMLSADVRHDYVRTMIQRLDQIELSGLQAMYLEMENQGASQLTKEGFLKKQIELLRKADMRYVGQSYELTIDVSGESIDKTVLNDLKNRFHQIHEKNYGYARLGEQIELVNLRLIALGKLPQSELVEPWPQTDKLPEPIAWRDVHFDGQNYRTPIHNRDQIGRDHILAGPTIIEQLDSTTVIPPGYRGCIEPYGNMIIEKEVEA